MKWRHAESFGCCPRGARRLLVAVIALSGVTSTGQPVAFAQRGGWLIEVEGEATPSSPDVLVHVYAWYEPVPGVADFFAGGDFDLVFGEPAVDPLVVRCGAEPIACPCISTISPVDIRDVCVGQVHFPPGGLFADPSTPIHVFTLGWKTSDFTARQVEVSTSNTRTFQASSFERIPVELYPERFTPGAGFIVVRDRDCYADCDASGALDLFDFLCYQNAFAAGDAYADCDASGALDFFDFLCFQNEFAAGCP